MTENGPIPAEMNLTPKDLGVSSPKASAKTAQLRRLSPVEKPASRPKETPPPQNFVAKELLPNATPSAKIVSCLATIENVIAESSKQKIALNEHEVVALELYRTLLKGASKSAQLANDPNAAQLAIRITVAMLDRMVVDEVSSRLAQRPNLKIMGKNAYFREYGFFSQHPDFSFSALRNPSVIFGIGDEANQTWQKLYKIATKPALLNSVDDIAKIPRTADYVFVSTALAYKDIRDLSTKIKLTNPHSVIVYPFQVDPSLKGVALENTQYNNGRYRAIHKAVSPMSEVPRQEIWRALLDKGKQLFPRRERNTVVAEDEEIVDLTSEELLRELNSFWQKLNLPAEERYQRMQDRKASVWLRAGKEQIDGFLERHIEHYRALLFNREHPWHGKAEIILTRSGISANEAAIDAIAEITGKTPQDRPKACVMSGFYFENIDTIQSKFTLTTNPSDANIFLINNEPTDPFNSLPYPGDYTKVRDELVKGVLGKAKSDPGNKYYIMYDKTTDLLHETFTAKDELPENVTVIETTSLTKQQRGAKNYFYGALGCWGNKEINPLLHDGVAKAQGNLTELGIIHMPRLRRGEIATRTIDFLKKNQLIADTVDRLQALAQIPINLRWRIQNQTFFSFVIPPPADELAAWITGRVSQRAKSEFRKALNQVNDAKQILGFDPTLSFELLKQSQEDGSIKYGSSFGLNETRLINFTPNPVHLEDFGETGKDVDPILLKQGIMRIAPGAQTSGEELQDFLTKAINPVLRIVQGGLQQSQANLPKAA